MIRCLVLFFLGLTVLITSFGVRAETVLIVSGPSEGQGWVFLRKTGCYVATPSHVLVPGAGGQVSGMSGYTGEIDQIFRHDTLDLAVAQIRGSLAENCPASGLGDVDGLATLQRISNEGRVVKFERRTGRADGNGDYGIDAIPIEILSLSATQPEFFFQVVGADLSPENAVIRSDSGSPVRMRGQGFGEAGLPLGLVTAKDYDAQEGFDQAFAIRMDAIRRFVEELNLDNRTHVTRKTVTGYSITEYTGVIPDTSCGSLNLEKDAPDCGWRVERGGSYQRISLIVRLEKRMAVSDVMFRFADGTQIDGVSLSVRTDGESWSYDRFCPGAAIGPILSCTLGDWAADELRIVFEADSIELYDIEIR